MIRLILFLALSSFVAFHSRQQIIDYSCQQWRPGVVVQVGGWEQRFSFCQVEGVK